MAVIKASRCESKSPVEPPYTSTYGAIFTGSGPDPTDAQIIYLINS
ncbi:hypothetical protein [Legionella qingyii]|nr:hypothetical protein [Legionella qingyii]